jgi:hypothetical protein
MVTTIERRVKRLEKPAGGGGGDGCGYCGGGGDDDDGNWDEPYHIFFADEEPEGLEEFCPECGRELVQNIYFDDDPRAPWNARRGLMAFDRPTGP